MSMAVSGYVRQFYRGNLFGATANARNGQPSHSLFSADMKALRRAVRELGNYDYKDEESDGEELVNKVKAFVNTYNNYIDSAKGMENEDVDRYLSKLKKLTKGNEDELSDIGITIQNDGQLNVDEKALSSTGRYQVSKLFAADAEYAVEAEKQMKKTYNMAVRNNLHIPKSRPQAAEKTQTGGNEESKPPVTDEGEESKPPAQEDMQLALQLAKVLAGNTVDYTI